jgi:hypothetical protein
MISTNERKPYNFRTFIVHKPVGVISSKVDPNPNNIVTNSRDERCGYTKDCESRKTLYDIAREAGFPTNCGLVGRLDVETSGIIMFSDDSRLASGIREPVSPDSPLANSPFKCKEYHLRLLSSRPYDPAKESEFDLDALQRELSQPLAFSRANCSYTCDSADIQILKRFRDESRSWGRPFLGWCIDVRVG